MQTKKRRPGRWLLFILAILTISILVVFYVYNPGKALKLIFPELNKISYITTLIKNDSAFTKISVVLQNKNPYKLSIDTLDFELQLNDTVIAHQKIVMNIEQSRFDIDTITVPLNLSIKQVMSLIANMQNKDSTTINVKGFAVYQTFFGRKKLEFDKNTKIEVPIPPKIKVLKVERKGYNIREKTLKANATIEIINRGKNLDLKITDIYYDMIVKNTIHSNGVISKPIIIKPQSSEIITIPIEIQIYHPLKTAWLVKIDKDRLNYWLHVKCNVQENLTERSLISPAEIEAKGILELVK
ncbi:MAG: LEA type 2 family protein [Bacteroidota bacterium]|nr:LEA type 2 family protein [Bacteroidota bacterium]